MVEGKQFAKITKLKIRKFSVPRISQEIFYGIRVNLSAFSRSSIELLCNTPGITHITFDKHLKFRLPGDIFRRRPSSQFAQIGKKITEFNFCCFYTLLNSRAEPWDQLSKVSNVVCTCPQMDGFLPELLSSR